MRGMEGKVLGAVKHSVHSLPGAEAVVGIAPGLLFRGGIILVQICTGIRKDQMAPGEIIGTCSVLVEICRHSGVRGILISAWHPSKVRQCHSRVPCSAGSSATHLSSRCNTV